MTAIVGIMNKHAAVLAADSATTSTLDANHRVITNYANKIISLSKYHPIGVMLFNSAAFEDTPWELILKLYRDQHLKDGHFPHVKDYFEDLKSYLFEKHYFMDESWSNVCIFQEIINLINLLRSTLFQRGVKWETRNSENLINEINGIITTLKGNPILSGFEDYTIEDFKLFLDSKIKDIYKDDEVVCALIDVIELYLYNFMIRRCLDYTGVVFIGYGDEDIFPQLYTVYIAPVLDGRLRYSVKDDFEINHNKPSVIAPYAQTDVINTITQGIHPDCLNAIENSFTSVFTALLSKIRSECHNQALERAIDQINVDDYRNGFNEGIFKYIKENYLMRLYSTVSYMDKEGLIEIAESLISLTSLQRKMTSSEASVGGPVDVAVITKTEGFVWIHRKYYFDPELNYQFLNRQKL